MVVNYAAVGGRWSDIGSKCGVLYLNGLEYDFRSNEKNNVGILGNDKETDGLLLGGVYGHNENNHLYVGLLQMYTLNLVNNTVGL